MDNTRLTKLIQTIQDVEGLLIEDPADLLYLTGISVDRGRLWVSSSETCFYVDGRFYDEAKRDAPCKAALHTQLPKTWKRAGFDSSYVSYQGFLSLQQNFPQTEWVPFPKPVKRLRVCKDREEIAILQRANQLTWRGYKKILELLKEGITEENLAFEFEFFCRKNGASSLSFLPIIAFGENSAYPHYRAGKARLQRDQLVLIDIGAVVDDYRADMTRVFFFGSPDPRLAHLDQVVKRVSQKAIAAIRPGIKIGELDRIAHEEFQKENLDPLFTHSLGHGIGLEAHEFPRIRFDGEDRELILQPGMVFTIEPGLYQPGLGGVRHEDMVLVTETGAENFNRDA